MGKGYVTFPNNLRYTNTPPVVCQEKSVYRSEVFLYGNGGSGGWWLLTNDKMVQYAINGSGKLSM